jgi:murein DD-endopeptidase MepM/ murein hydrolase activator NlpD
VAFHFFKKKKTAQTYTLVLFPSENAEQQRVLSFSLWKTILTLAFILAFGFFSILAVFLWTPVGKFILPSSHEETTTPDVQLFQTNIQEVNAQLIELRENNLQLRRMLGQKVSKEDSLFLVEQRSNPEREERLLQQLQERTSSETSHNSYSKYSSSDAKNFSLEFPLLLPTQGFFSRSFESEQGHIGVDIVGKNGTPVVTPADGYIVFSSWTYDYGNTIILAHSDGLVTVYKHLATLLQSPFTNVRRGNVLATLGNTGRLSTGPHLHFEMWKNGMPINPEHFFLQTNNEQLQ